MERVEHAFGNVFGKIKTKVNKTKGFDQLLQSTTEEALLNSSQLQDKLVQNERERSTIGDGDSKKAQFLADERLALMLQNEEFLSILRDDDDFMKTLQRDRMNATAFEPASTDTHQPSSDQMEGYGDDRNETLGAFPHDQAVPKDDDAEFRRQLKNMGGSSKKKFMALAKKFLSGRKKKKSPKTILSRKESGGQSTMNLLDDNDDDNFDDQTLSRLRETDESANGDERYLY